MNDIERELRERFARTEARLTGPDFAPSVAPGHLLRRTRRRQLGVAAVALLAAAVLVFGAVTSVASLVGSSERLAPAEPTQRLTPAGPTPNGAVTVTVSGLERHVGDQLAGVLYKVDRYPGHAIGGFAAIVSDASPITQVVHRPDRHFDSRNELFPYVLEDVLTVQPGKYTLFLWLGPRIGPYSRWTPGDDPGLKVCRTTFIVKDLQGTAVDLTAHVLAATSPPRPHSCVTV